MSTDKLTRIVIDTNVWLDLLVFRHPACDAIAHALKQGWAQAMATQDMLDELDIVLRRPPFLARHANPLTLLDKVYALIERQSAPAFLTGPQCKDKADQKFIDLAVSTKADFLISKDNAVLKLDHRLRPCGVAPPECFQLAQHRLLKLSVTRGKQQRTLKLALDGMVVGTAVLQKRGSVIFLSEWTVLPEMRGRGYGRALLSASEAVGRGLGGKEMHTPSGVKSLESVPAERIPIL